MKEEVRVCVVGTGRAGMVHARNLRWNIPHAELAAVVDSEPERVRQAARELELGDAFSISLEEAFAATDIQAVVITSPTFTHAAMAMTSARAGKHVFCEKPMALTLDECDGMIEAARQAGVVLQMGFMRRYDPDFVAAKAEIEAGKIGRVLMVRSLTRGPGLPPEWALDSKASHGMLAEVNSHDFDTIRWLSGGNYTSAFVRAGALKVPELRSRYPAFYDTAVALLQLDNGALGVLDGVCPATYGYDARAEVVGSEGVMFIGEMKRLASTRVTREAGFVGEHFRTWPDRFRQAYVEEMTQFVECIRKGHAPRATGQDGRSALEAVIAGNRSIQTGQPVSLPLDS